MTSIARSLVLVILNALFESSMSQNDFTPLWPCYSVFKVPLPTNGTVQETNYRYTGRFVSSGDVHNLDDPDCIFTIEGPPKSRVQLQLSNVLIQKPGYVSTSQQNGGNCSVGAVRIYNFTLTGALVQVNEVCNSFTTGPKLLSDTNVAIVSTTIARGHFDLQVSIIPTNETVRRRQLVRRLPDPDENLIFLGHTQEERDSISNLLNPPPQIEAPEETQPLNSSEPNSLDNDYYDEYTYSDNNEINNEEFFSNQGPRQDAGNQIKRPNKINNQVLQHRVDQKNQQQSHLDVISGNSSQDDDYPNKQISNQPANQRGQQNKKNNISNTKNGQSHRTKNKFSNNQLSGNKIRQQNNKLSNFIQNGNFQLPEKVLENTEDEADQIENIPIRNKFNEPNFDFSFGEFLPLRQQFLQQLEQLNKILRENQLPQHQPATANLIKPTNQLSNQNRLPKPHGSQSIQTLSQFTDSESSLYNTKLDQQQQLVDFIKDLKLNTLHHVLPTINSNLPQKTDKTSQKVQSPIFSNIQKQTEEENQSTSTAIQEDKQLELFLNQLVQAASNLIPINAIEQNFNKLGVMNTQNIQPTVDSKQDTQAKEQFSQSNFPNTNEKEQVSMNVPDHQVPQGDVIEHLAEVLAKYIPQLQSYNKNQDQSEQNTNATTKTNKEKNISISDMHMGSNQVLEKPEDQIKDTSGHSPNTNTLTEIKKVTEAAYETPTHKVFLNTNLNSGHRENSKFANPEKLVNSPTVFLASSTEIKPVPETNSSKPIPAPVPRNIPLSNLVK